MTSTFTTTATFTRTHAKHLAAKVIADLYQCSVFYDRPTVDAIDVLVGQQLDQLGLVVVDGVHGGAVVEHGALVQLSLIHI